MEYELIVARNFTIIDLFSIEGLIEERDFFPFFQMDEMTKGKKILIFHLWVKVLPHSSVFHMAG